jgi:hypothetical protein
MRQLTIPLKAEEKQALFKLAESKEMDPRRLARFIIRHALKKLGELSPKAHSKKGS